MGQIEEKFAKLWKYKITLIQRDDECKHWRLWLDRECDWYEWICENATVEWCVDMTIKYLKDEKLLEPQKKAEVCTACYGKWTYSVFEWNKVASVDFVWDKSYIVEKWGIKEYPCKRCGGTGEKPVYFPEPHQEDKKIELINIKFVEWGELQSPISRTDMCNKINEIITYLNNR